MLYAKLAYKNVRASFHDYLLYFLTLALTVSLFYCFNASSTLNILDNYNDLPASFPKLLYSLSHLMFSLSFLTAGILTILVLYANHIFILRRKKEFALYYVLGMKQHHLALVLFLEAFFVALLALGAGIIIGILASQFIFTFTASLFVNHVIYHFFFSPMALLFTLLAFFAIFFITTFANNLFFIYRPSWPYRSHTRHVVSFSKASFFLTLLCTLICSFCCFILLQFSLTPLTLFLVVLLMMLSNLFLLLAFSKFLLIAIKKRHSYCFRGLHLLTLRRLYELLASNPVTMCILSFSLSIGITFLFSGLCISNNLNNEVESLTPYSFSLIHRYSDNSNQDLHWKTFDQQIAQLHVNTDVIRSETIVHTFQSDFTYHSLQSLLEDFNIDVPENMEGLKNPIEILPLSAYNQLRRDQGLEDYKLKPENVLLYSVDPRFSSSLKELSKSNASISLYGRSLHIQSGKGKAMRPSSMNENILQESVLLVVHDTMIPYTSKSYADYWNVKLKTGESTRSFASSVEKAIVKNEKNLSLNSFYMVNRDDIHDSNVGFSVLFTYIALYIGIILIVCSLIILSLKLLAPVYNDHATATLLEKLGTPLPMRRRDLFWQTFLYFSLPLILSVINSFLFLKIISLLYYEFQRSGYIAAFFQTFALVFLLFISYFSITYYSRRSMAGNRKVSTL